jgi:addiction module HigA family antidote
MSTGKTPRSSRSAAANKRVAAKKPRKKVARIPTPRRAQVQSGEITPGEILNEEFLRPMGITAYRLAKSIGVDQAAVGEIIAGKRGISASMALRFARFFGTTPDLWLNLQKNYELRLAQRELGSRLARIQPFHDAA